MSLFHPWALAAVAACSVALVAGPVSAWTRRYVRQPLRDYNDDSVDSATSDDDGRAHAGDDIIIASGSSEAEADDARHDAASTRGRPRPRNRHTRRYDAPLSWPSSRRACSHLRSAVSACGGG